MTVEKTSAWTDAERTKHRPPPVVYVAPTWENHNCIDCDEYCALCNEEAFHRGAAVLAGITGMGWAIWGRVNQ